MNSQIDFQQIFNAVPQTQASAPGRVNLLGEHTDYNDGFVLPTAIPQHTTVSLGFSPDDRHHFYSAELEEWVHFTNHESIPEGFASYVLGCIRVLEKIGHTVPPFNLFVTSSVPIGSGLSSSATLEVATLRGLRSLLHLDLDDVQIAKLGQQAEIQLLGFSAALWIRWQLASQILTIYYFWILAASIANFYPCRHRLKFWLLTAVFPAL